MTAAILWLGNLAIYLLVLVGSLAIIAGCGFVVLLAIGWTLTGLDELHHWWKGRP